MPLPGCKFFDRKITNDPRLAIWIYMPCRERNAPFSVKPMFSRPPSQWYPVTTVFRDPSMSRYWIPLFHQPWLALLPADQIERLPTSAMNLFIFSVPSVFRSVCHLSRPISGLPTNFSFISAKSNCPIGTGTIGHLREQGWGVVKGRSHSWGRAAQFLNFLIGKAT